ncbi:hypothetical protein ACO0OL_002300 [Hanseniaspora opuntiae]|jgi:hypothetical protein|uniref:54S ribosomal protein L44, mitochondrial n=1 Tax=Hanseniaspora opuntiae TaxID=211096 RepID=A0A1E5RST9_9ASCO|nr:hypothetical protein AWRI3578_g1014 [Hanseniaspora opuntiae]
MALTIPFGLMSKVMVNFNPLNTKSSKLCRTILDNVPPSLVELERSFKVLPPSSSEKELIKFTFKDNKEFSYDPCNTQFDLMVHEVSRYNKVVKLKESIEKYA